MSREDRRRLRRATRITVFLWGFILVAFLGGSVLPYLVAGRLGSGDVVGTVENGIGVAIIFGALLGGASFFLPERPLPTFGRVVIGLMSLVLGILALTTSIALLLASGQFAGADGAWVLVGVAALSAFLGILLTREGYRALATEREVGPWPGRN